MNETVKKAMQLMFALLFVGVTLGTSQAVCPAGAPPDTKRMRNPRSAGDCCSQRRLSPG